MNQVAQRNQGTQVQLSSAKQKLAQMFLNAGLETILPSHITMDQFVQVAAIAYMKEPKLAEATQDSLMMAFTECAKDGLIPNGKEAFVNCYKKNFGNKQRPDYRMVAEYQPMIEGVLKRARQSGDVQFIDVGFVFPEETFEHWTGVEGKHFKHVPDYTIDRSMERITLFYGIAKLKSGEIKTEVMPRDEVEKVRGVSLAKNASTWVTWFDRMGLKVVGHRLCRQLPKGAELIAMLEKGDEKNFSQEAIDVTPTNNNVSECSPALTVNSLMGSENQIEHTNKQSQAKVIEQKTSKPADVNDLMGGGQSTTNNDDNVYSTLEDLIISIGSTNDRKETIAEYRHAVEEVRAALNNNEITQDQADLFNAQLRTIHGAISGNN